MANNFASDTNCLAVFNFENGALTTDSKGSATLNAYNTPTADTVNFREGAASVLLVGASHQYFEITDANLPAGWPLKTGDTNLVVGVGLWFRPNSVTGNQCLIAKDTNSFGTAYGIYLNGTTLYVTAPNVSINMGTVSIGNWYYVALSSSSAPYSGSGIGRRYYGYFFDVTNGIQTIKGGTSDSWGMTANSAVFRIGGVGGQNSTWTFDGNIDEVVVFNRLVSMSEWVQIRKGVFGGATAPCFYVDPVNGSDANTADGATWGTAWKTPKSRPLLSDTVKTIKNVENSCAGTVTATTGSLSVATTNDLTAVLAQYSIIRISGDDTLYMIKAITSSVISLYRPYRGVTGSGKGLTYLTLFAGANGDWTSAYVNGTKNKPTVMMGGVNSSNDVQDGFSVWNLNNNALFSGTWCWTNFSRLGVYYCSYAWVTTCWDCNFEKMFNFRSVFGLSNTFRRFVINGWVNEGIYQFGANSTVTMGTMNNIETGGVDQQFAFSTMQRITVNNWKHAGNIYASYGIVGVAGTWLDVRFVNTILEEIPTGTPNIAMNTAAIMNNVIFENTTLTGGLLITYWTNTCISGAIQISNSNVGGTPVDNVTIIGTNNTEINPGLHWMLSKDSITYKTAAPSSRLEGYSSFAMCTERLYIPCDAGVTKTVGLWMMKNNTPILTTSLNTAGSGYAIGDIFAVVQAGGYGGLYQVLTLSGSGVATYNKVSGGSNYAVANGLSTTTLTGGGSGCKLNILTVGIGYGLAPDFPAFLRVKWITGTLPNCVSNTVNIPMPDVVNTWQQLSQAVTPSVQGAIILEVWVTSYNPSSIVWFDDIGIA